MSKKIMLFITAMIVSSLVVGCAANATAVKKVGTSPDGNEVKIEAAAMKLVKAVQEHGYELVGTDELNTWVQDAEDLIIIDTMPSDFYAKGHVPAALNAVMPKTGLADATDAEKAAFAELLGDDLDKKIVIYCGFTACGRSDAGASYAVELGYTNVHRYPGGIIAWRDAELTEEK